MGDFCVRPYAETNLPFAFWKSICSQDNTKKVYLPVENVKFHGNDGVTILVTLDRLTVN